MPLAPPRLQGYRRDPQGRRRFGFGIEQPIRPPMFGKLFNTFEPIDKLTYCLRDGALNHRGNLFFDIHGRAQQKTPHQ
jgi:hypothetical protein